MYGFVVQVSSFETTARDAEEKDVQLSKLPEGYDEKDMRRWRNSLKRDFTINRYVDVCFLYFLLFP